MGTFVVFSPPTFPTWIRTIDLLPTRDLGLKWVWGGLGEGHVPSIFFV